MPSNDVFISYRRAASEDLAYAIYQGLKLRQIDPFFDYQSIPAGKWLDVIMRQIAARPYFLLILAPGTLDRCVDANDVLRREIHEAVRLERVIIPVTTHGFDRKDIDRFLPPASASEIHEHQFHDWPDSRTYYDYALDILRDRYLKPIEIVVTAAPVSDTTLLRENQTRVETSAKDESPPSLPFNGMDLTQYLEYLKSKPRKS